MGKLIHEGSAWVVHFLKGRRAVDFALDVNGDGSSAGAASGVSAASASEVPKAVTRGSKPRGR